MSGNEVELHQARGPIVVTGIHLVHGLGPDLENIMSMRWKDSNDDFGQSSHVRLALYIERGDTILIEDNGEQILVQVSNDARHLKTQGRTADDDPILRLPQYVGHPSND
jgi:hypothetical protein